MDKFPAGQAGLEATVVDNLWISVTVPLAGCWLAGWVSRAGGGHGRHGGLSNLAGLGYYWRG